LRTLALPLIALRGQRVELRLQAVARFDHELDLGFQAADLGIGLVQVTLSLMHAVAGGVMRLPHVFQLGFDVTQFARSVLPARSAPFRYRGNIFPARSSLRFCAAATAVSAFRPDRLAVHGIFARPLPGFPVFQIGIQFAQDIFHSYQVFARILQRFSVSRRRSLYLDTPAASSRKIRSSSGRASMMREIMPCPMIA
jgi:hypothetical protein